MKAILCEYTRNTCTRRKKERVWISEELARIYKKKKIVKFVMVDGMPRTRGAKKP
jgi:hypothetical protein